VIKVECKSGDLCIDDKKKDRPPIYVVLHLDTAWAALNWSAGFSVSSLRDQRIQIQDQGDGKQPLLARLEPNGPTPIQLAAYAHYCWTSDNFEWLCFPTLGLATDLKEGFQLTFGPALRAKVIPSTNSFYLTFGAVYGQRKVINDDFVGRVNQSVPVGTTSASVLTSKYSWGGFVGVSFGFLGSSDKFTGVYSKGKTSPADTSEKADKKGN
jgi:hypothetical protein